MPPFFLLLHTEQLLWVIPLTSRQQSAAMVELHSGPQHSLLALGLCLDRAFKHSDVLCSLQKKKKSNSACMCVWVCLLCVVCLYMWEFFIQCGDKRQKCVWAPPTSHGSVTPPSETPTPKDPTRGRVYTLFIKTTVWEKNGTIISKQ